MSTVMYPKAKQKVFEGSINWTGDTIKVALLDSTYVYDAAHEFYSSISGVVGTPQTLTGKSNTLGVLDALNTVFPSLTGSTVTRLLIYKDTGAAATSPVIFYIDSARNIPFQPNGRDATVEWDDGPFKIYTIEDNC